MWERMLLPCLFLNCNNIVRMVQNCHVDPGVAPPADPPAPDDGGSYPAKEQWFPFHSETYMKKKMENIKKLLSGKVR